MQHHGHGHRLLRRQRDRVAVVAGMVLHELCFNALVHGLRWGGTLTIRARDGLVPDELAVDVVDDGGSQCRTGEGANGNAGHVGNAGHAFSTGMGLALVRGLVGRELRGRFSVGPNTDGGTTATIEFPVSSPAGADGGGGLPDTPADGESMAVVAGVIGAGERR